jgi:hypothetical protein
VNVPAGKHAVSVKKSGYQDWVREMNFSGGAITLSAELVPGSSTPVAAQLAQGSVDASSAQEVSLAEAARRNKAAREAAQSAQQNPPQQQ